MIFSYKDLSKVLGIESGGDRTQGSYFHFPVMAGQGLCLFWKVKLSMLCGQSHTILFYPPIKIVRI